ncbi:MAG: hypothetical protein OXQ84_18645, partial [bacterium]|nr:hypothetical protein [bacterium]
MSGISARWTMKREISMLADPAARVIRSRTASLAMTARWRLFCREVMGLVVRLRWDRCGSRMSAGGRMT